MPRSKIRHRTCQNCEVSYELGVDSKQIKYCSVECRNQWHYNKWKSNSGHRDKRKTKSYWLKHTYGIDIEQYEAMLEGQQGLCACCGTDEPTGYNWHVDHCHSTGKVRSLLCSRCNQGIGLFDEDPVKLTKAIEYLGRHNESD